MNVEAILRSKGREVVTIAPDATAKTAIEMLRHHGIGALIVSRDGATIEGILSERDIIHALAAHGGTALDFAVARLMTSPVFTRRASDSIAELMALMTERRIRHVPVIEDGTLAGIVSIGDVVKSLLKETELEATVLREYITAH